MKSKNQKIYDKLKKQGLTDEDIADSMVFPSELTKEEKEKSDNELKEILKKLRNEKK